MIDKLFPPRMSYLCKYLMAALTLLFLMRLVFFFSFFSGEDFSSWQEIIFAFYLGFKFDLRLLLFLLIPLFFLTFVPALNPLRGGGEEIFKRRWSKIFSFFTLLLIQVHCVDLATYSYLKVRLSSTLLRFMNDPLISLQMVWQTYPVLPFLILSVGFYFFFQWILRAKILSREGEGPKKKVLSWGLVFLLWGLGLYGKISFYPLRWSEAFFSHNSFISYLALNPVLFFVDTLTFKEIPYDISATQKNYLSVARYLGVPKEFQDQEKLNFDRKVHSTPIGSRTTGKGKTLGPPNIVVMVMESMVAYKSGLYGNKLDATPHLDLLAAESLHFRRFYVPSQATARSIFALVTGIPDVSEIKSGSRNPFIIEQHSLMNALKDYQKFYMIGGSASWGNIRGIFSHNIEGIDIREEGSYESPRMDVWGLSDYHLFAEANKLFRQQDDNKPFVALVQSASFHRPYSLPAEGERGGFIPRVFETKEQKEELKKYGFISAEEYNSLLFQDFSLGQFFIQAKKEKYYDNTIFFIFGDHGLPVNNASNVAEGEKRLDLENFHVPLLIHGPRFVEAGEDHRFVSELDIFPTIAGLLGISATNTTLGRNIFDKNFDGNRSVFTYTWYTRPVEFGLLNKDFYYLGNLAGKRELYRYGKKENPAGEVGKEYPQVLEEMEELAHGLYQASRYLMYHNPKKVH